MGKKSKYKLTKLLQSYDVTMGSKFDYIKIIIPVIIGVTTIIGAVVYNSIYSGYEVGDVEGVSSIKEPEKTILGECSKLRNSFASKMDKALSTTSNYEKTYYSMMGKMLDNIYASTKIGFECRPFIVWDMRNTYSRLSPDSPLDLESFQYSSATLNNHQPYKIKADLSNGRKDHNKLSYIDLDTYANKMAYSSKHSHHNVEGKPKQVNGIWLTNKSFSKEIHNDDIRSLIEQKNFFKKDGEWSHVVWTNDKFLIPKSVKALEKEGIEVRSIYDYKDEIKLFSEIIKLIDSNKFAMASDLLRCSITYNEGGVYADINYKFIQKIEQYYSKFDLFTADQQNNFFCVKKGHIVFKEMLNRIESDFKNHPEYLTNKDIDRPIELIYSQYAASLIKFSNEEGNIDFYYDYYDAHGIKDEGPIGQDNAGLTHHTWVY